MKIPHGAANALIFPYTLAYNAPVAQEKTAIVMKALGLAATADEISIRKQTTELLSGYGLKTKLRDYDIPHEDLQGMAQEASTIRRLLDNNPRDIDIDDILTIYEAAY